MSDKDFDASVADRLKKARERVKDLRERAMRNQLESENAQKSLDEDCWEAKNTFGTDNIEELAKIKENIKVDVISKLDTLEEQITSIDNNLKKISGV